MWLLPVATSVWGYIPSYMVLRTQRSGSPGLIANHHVQGAITAAPLTRAHLLLTVAVFLGTACGSTAELITSMCLSLMEDLCLGADHADDGPLSTDKQGSAEVWSVGYDVVGQDLGVWSCDTMLNNNSVDPRCLCCPQNRLLPCFSWFGIGRGGGQCWF